MSQSRPSHSQLSRGQLSDIHLAAIKVHGSERRAFAEMTFKYCHGTFWLELENSRSKLQPKSAAA